MIIEVIRQILRKITTKQNSLDKPFSYCFLQFLNYQTEKKWTESNFCWFIKCEMFIPKL